MLKVAEHQKVAIVPGMWDIVDAMRFTFNKLADRYRQEPSETIVVTDKYRQGLEWIVT